MKWINSTKKDQYDSKYKSKKDQIGEKHQKTNKNIMRWKNETNMYQQKKKRERTIKIAIKSKVVLNIINSKNYKMHRTNKNKLE